MFGSRISKIITALFAITCVAATPVLATKGRVNAGAPEEFSAAEQAESRPALRSTRVRSTPMPG
jgi:hypothetical protein